MIWRTFNGLFQNRGKMLDLILAGLTVAVPSLGAGIVIVRKGLFYYKAIKQAIDVFDEVKEANKDIYLRVKNDPDRKELAMILSGGVKKIEGLAGV